mmetsp:Transcript_26160/g.25340  ORF Transcript_26160/g.25340 Transcript_26160/m.25340 type:complete len:117 (-) Transcript_26160:136-486(-)
MFGATVGLKTKVKMIPKAKDTFGAFFLNQPARSMSYMIGFDFSINSEMSVSDIDENPVGLAFWHLHKKPTFPQNFGKLLGMNNDYNGLGVFVFLDTDQKWKISIHEKGRNNEIKLS